MDAPNLRPMPADEQKWRDLCTFCSYVNICIGVAMVGRAENSKQQTSLPSMRYQGLKNTFRR